MLIFTRIMLAVILSFVLIESPVIVANAQSASMISTQSAVMDLTAERDGIRNFVAREDVKQQLLKLGLSDQEINSRIASLSDNEVQNLSSQIDQAKAGGNLLVIVLIVVLIFFLVKKY